MEKQRKTFLSYSRINKEFAIRLAKELKAEGFDIWLDQLDIPAGSRWDREVERALKESEIFMIILTAASVDSENVLDEIGYAIDSSKRFLPVLLEKCDVPLRLRRFQYVDFTNKSFDGGVESAKELLRDLIAQTTIPRGEVPVISQEKNSRAKAEPDYKLKVKPAEAMPVNVKAKSLSAAPARMKPASKGLTIGIVAVVVLVIAGIVMSILNRVPATNQATETPIVENTATEALVVSKPVTDTPVAEPLVTEPPTIHPSATHTPAVQPINTPTITTRIVSTDGMLQVLIEDAGFAFWIDKTEVTNGMYKLCALNNACTDTPAGLDNPYQASYYENGEFNLYPVVFVNQFDAHDYCAWVGRRLLTAAEWGLAARGSGERSFDTGTITYYVAGTFDTSIYAVNDMGGQITEWTEEGLIEASGQISFEYPLDGQNFGTGIRCASSYP